MIIVIWGELSDGKFISKIDPLVKDPVIKKIYLYRFNGNPYNNSFNGKIKYFDFMTKYNKLYIFFGFFNMILKILTHKIDLLVGIYFYPHGFLISLAASIFGIKDVQILPGSDLAHIKKNKLLAFFLKKSFRVGVRGSRSSDEVAKLRIPREKIFILNNIFNLQAFIENSKKSVLDQKIYDLLFVGYFRKEKCLEKLIEIILELKKNKEDISCMMIGDGPEKERISNLIEKYKLSNNISIMPHDEEIARWYQYGKIFILTSSNEGLNMSMIEAMSLGLPVVVPKINDLEEVVTDGVNGFLIPPEFEVFKYVNKINELLQNEDIYSRFSKNAIHKISDLCEKHYSENAVSDVWKKIIYND